MSSFLIYVCVAGLFYFTRCFCLMEVMEDEDTINSFGPLKHNRTLIYIVCLLFGFILLPIEIVWELCEPIIEPKDKK